MVAGWQAESGPEAHADSNQNDALILMTSPLSSWWLAGRPSLALKHMLALADVLAQNHSRALILEDDACAVIDLPPPPPKYVPWQRGEEVEEEGRAQEGWWCSDLG